MFSPAQAERTDLGINRAASLPIVRDNGTAEDAAGESVTDLLLATLLGFLEPVE